MPEDRRDVEGKGAYVISQLYYYGAAVIGIGFLLGGAVAAIIGLRTLVLPQDYQGVGDGVRRLLMGVAFAGPGVLLAWSHVREARARDGGPYTDAFWGASLYFHLVALVALGFMLVGSIGVLTSLIDLVLPNCFETFAAVPAGGELAREECYPPPSEAVRSALDFALVLLVSAPVWWWHLREGRKLVGAPADAASPSPD